jgi:hypothetical protein
MVANIVKAGWLGLAFTRSVFVKKIIYKSLDSG